MKETIKIKGIRAIILRWLFVSKRGQYNRYCPFLHIQGKDCALCKFPCKVSIND